MGEKRGSVSEGAEVGVEVEGGVKEVAVGSSDIVM